MPEAARCSGSPRCRKRPEIRLSEDERLCKGHARDLADKLVGDFVKARDGYRCQLRGFNAKPCWPNEEAVYWCHLIPKGRYGATRWVPLNAVAGCAGHHKAFDESPLEKDLWIEQRIGAEAFEELRLLARMGGGPSAAEIILRYRQNDGPERLPSGRPIP